MSLTEEKVIELQKQMQDKKEEFDRLSAMTVYQIWEGDLDRFLVQLDKHEEQEEKDRLAHTANAENGGKKGKGQRAKPKGVTAGGPAKGAPK